MKNKLQLKINYFIIIFLLCSLQLNSSFAQCSMKIEVIQGVTNKHLNSVYFMNEKTGFAVGNNGTIIKTIDGGINWSIQNSVINTHLNAVYFSNEKNGYIAGDKGIVLRTINGGTTWIKENSGSNKDLKSIHFKNVSEGIIVGNGGELLKTVDEGKNWEKKESNSISELNSVKYVDENIVFAVGENGTILKSEDSGNNWSLKNIDLTESYIATLFIEDSKGYLLNDSKSNIVKKTNDKGETWNNLDLNIEETEKIKNAFFINANTGYLVGNNGKILFTENAGENWIEIPSGTEKHLSSIHFTSLTSGFAVGNNGTILRIYCDKKPVSSTTATNDFKIGMFGMTGKPRVDPLYGCNSTLYDTPLDENGYKTSTLNVISQDGFNIVNNYTPHTWSSEVFTRNLIKLAKANNMQVLLNSRMFYKPSISSKGGYLGYGTNTYNSCGNVYSPCESPADNGNFFPNYDYDYSNIYTNNELKNIIWGFHITEEASYRHDLVSSNCKLSGQMNIEIPPANVGQALTYFKNLASTNGLDNKKFIIMEDNHGKAVNDNTNDEECVYVNGVPNCFQNQPVDFNPQQYIKLLNKGGQDVFFEASYTQFPITGWKSQSYADIFNNGWHYLGCYKSIDYAKNYSSNIHKIVGSYLYEFGDMNQLNKYYTSYHSDLNIKNANFLWFQAYNSIIHGAKGIWFWWQFDMWEPDENYTIWDWNSTKQNRFDKLYFPRHYKNYVSNLSKELRYLVNNNLLSTDPSSVIATKTDQEDPLCIVPASFTYLPAAMDSKYPEKWSENYGLRYTIRSNGEKVIMIISNPLNVPVSTTLDFSQVANPKIKNAYGVYFRFESEPYNVSSTSYKTNRNSNIHLDWNTSGTETFFKNLGSDKRLNISFGPMDVHILEFASTPPNHNNGWDLAWSNMGSGLIDGHQVKDIDKFYIGDFDGDGTEELFCVQSTGVDGNWMNLLKFRNGKWEWMWSNYGSSSAGNGIYPYRGNLLVGDFDGDGKDDLLGNDSWTTMFEFKNGDWHWKWSDYGNANHLIRPYKDKIYVGDFRGIGRDQILGCDFPNGWTTILQYVANDFVWGGWSDNGTNNHIRPYRHSMFVSDYNGDGKDDLLGVSTTSTWATLFHYYNNGWQWGWSNYGASNFNGWGLPLRPTDKVLTGNIDEDAKNEIMFIQTGNISTNGGWAASMDIKNGLDGWNWNWSATPAIPYIDDWAVNEENISRYYFIKAQNNAPKYLLAMRKYKCGNYLVNMYKSNPNNNKNYVSAPFNMNDTTMLPIDEINLSQESIEKNNDRPVLLNIFPNPNNGEFSLLFTGIDNNSQHTIEVFNPLGQAISKVENVKLVFLQPYPFKLNSDESGVYILKLSNQNEVYFKRFNVIK